MKQSFKFIFSFFRLIAICLISLSIALTIALGFSINNFLCFFLGLGFLIIETIYSIAPPPFKKTLNVFVFSSLSLLCLFIGIMSCHEKNIDTTNEEKIAIVLGSGIRGTILSPMLKERLDKALDYYHQNPRVNIIVSGGKGRGEDISEAQSMAEYLSIMGIPETQIVQERKSKNTKENLYFSKKIVEEKFPKELNQRIVLITTDFHMFRAKKMAENLELNISTYSSSIDWYLRPGTYLREIISILKYYITD